MTIARPKILGICHENKRSLPAIAIASRYLELWICRASGIGRSTRSSILTLLDVTGQTYVRAARAILSREDLRFPAARFRRTIFGGKHTEYTEQTYGFAIGKFWTCRLFPTICIFHFLKPLKTFRGRYFRAINPFYHRTLIFFMLPC